MCAEGAQDATFMTRVLKCQTLGQMPVTNTGSYIFSFYRRENTICLHYKDCPVNLLKPTGYGMHQQVEHFNNRTLCPYSICVFCICLRTSSNLCHLSKKLIGFYNRDEKCLQRGTDWACKWSSLRSAF
jgi:hypothetical protein